MQGKMVLLYNTKDNGSLCEKEAETMREIYLDNSATTRVYPEAADAAYRVMTEIYGNPSSLHKKGIEAEQVMTEARGKIAAALGADAEGLVLLPAARRPTTSP